MFQGPDLNFRFKPFFVLHLHCIITNIHTKYVYYQISPFNEKIPTGTYVLLLKNSASEKWFIPEVGGQLYFNKQVIPYLQWIILIFTQGNFDTCHTN